MNKITEKASAYNDLELMSTNEILKSINREDQTVPEVIASLIPDIEKLVDAITDKMFIIISTTLGHRGILSFFFLSFKLIKTKQAK